MPTQAPKRCKISDCEKYADARGWCTMHYKRWQKHGDPNIVLTGNREPTPLIYKDEKLWGRTCYMCKVDKPKTEFTTNLRAKGGLHSYCNDCRLARAKRDRKRNEDKQRIWDRKRVLRKYGLTIEDYESMLVQQNGTCAICDGTKTGYKNGTFAVDHCHTTNRVRGLLCSKCNMAIGYMDDQPERLERAATYLRGNKP